MPLKKSNPSASPPLKKSKSGDGTDERGVAAAERGVGGSGAHGNVNDTENKFFNIESNIKK